MKPNELMILEKNRPRNNYYGNDHKILKQYYDVNCVVSYYDSDLACLMLIEGSTPNKKTRKFDQKFYLALHYKQVTTSGNDSVTHLICSKTAIQKAILIIESHGEVLNENEWHKYKSKILLDAL